MATRKFEVVNADTSFVYASGMTLENALLFMEAYCNKYFNEPVDLALREMGDE